MAKTSMNDIFTFNEAVEYVGLHPQTLEYHQREGNLVPDRQLVGGDRLYHRATLDAFKDKFRAEGMTPPEIRERYGITFNQYRYAFRMKRQAPIVGNRGAGKMPVYSLATVKLIADAEGWTEVTADPAAASA